MSNEDPSIALANIVNVIEKDELASGNIIQLDQSIKLAITKQTEILLGFDIDADSKDVLSVYFTASLMDLSEKLLGSQSAFLGLPSKQRRDVIDSVQKNVDDTLYLLASNSVYEKYQKEVDNLGNFGPDNCICIC